MTKFIKCVSVSYSGPTCIYYFVNPIHIVTLSIVKTDYSCFLEARLVDGLSVAIHPSDYGKLLSSSLVSFVNDEIKEWIDRVKSSK